MKFRDIFSLSTRGFKTNTSRTILTILGVGVGIGAVLFLVSLGYGLQNIVLNNITTADALLTLDVSSGSELLQLTKEKVAVISAMPEVTETSPGLSLSGQMVQQDSMGDSLVYLVDKSFFRLGGLNMETGREFASNDAYEIVVSSAATKIFGFNKSADIIGQTFKINLFIPDSATQEITVANLQPDYKVVGVITDDNTSFVYLPTATIGQVNLPPYSDLKVKIKSSEQLNTARTQIISQGFLVSSLSETIDQTKKIFQIIQIVLGSFGLIALIVSAIGMFNTMTITLLERTQEIGIMRAVGVTNRDVVMIFLFESVLMGFFGGIAGIIIGYVSGEAFNLGINILAHNFGGQSLGLFYRPTWFLLFVLWFSVLTGFLTGLYPARRAAKLNPLDALRYK